MNRTKWWNPSLGPVSLCVLLFVIHAILKELLSRFDVVSCIFAAGNHVPRWMISCAATFAAVRLSVFLLIPAILAWRAATALVSRFVLREYTSQETGLPIKSAPNYEVERYDP